MRLNILHSISHEPAFNAAVEEYLFRNRDTEQAYLMLYTNAPSVHIGRNQNPWQECNLGWCDEHQVGMLRRISGGGTVFHDPGCLNYAFILPREEYQPDKYVGLVRQALRRNGAPAEIQGQHSLWVGQAKVSGTACALAGKNCLIHGCILVETDLGALSAALRPVPGVAFTGGVASVRAPVANVMDIAPNCRLSVLERAIRMEAIDHFLQNHADGEVGDTASSESDLTPKIRDILDERQSSDWLWGHTPEFTAEDARGATTLRYVVRHGLITEPPELAGKPFSL
ncbi:MAG: hypothetical protein IJJ33_04030 [Victivallales bacterium]|nr:hypothetical protein [Victivallales bacterium]